MKLLLVTWYFPPTRTIAAVRLGKLARYLLARGHDIRVLTPQDPPLPQDLAFDFPAERVIRTPWQAANAGSAPAGYDQETAAAGTMPAAVGGEPTLLKRKYWRLHSSFSRFPDARAPWLPFALEAGGELLADWRPDLLYASGPPSDGWPATSGSRMTWPAARATAW